MKREHLIGVPVTITPEELEIEERASGPQCPSVFGTQRTIVFCKRREGHEGHHRGDYGNIQAQWREWRDGQVDKT